MTVENGTWENLTDSMLGVPEGENSTRSVVEGQCRHSDPAQSLSGNQNSSPARPASRLTL